MFYNLTTNNDRQAAKEYLDKLLEKKCKIELKEVKPPRTLKQNAFIHVVINLYAIAYGCTTNEAKTDLKRDYGLFYEKNGKKYLISTADLDNEQLSRFIDWIRNRAAKELNYYIPTGEQYLIDKFNIDKEIEKNKEHL